MVGLFKMINQYNDTEVEKIRESSLLVGKTLAEIAKHIKPGVKTIELDRIAEQFIRDHGATPEFKGYRGYQHALCISVNDVVIHGIPNEYELKDGDIVAVDCGVRKNGFVGDSAYTFAVGNVSEEAKHLMKTTRECLELGIAEAFAGNRVGDIGFAIQQHAEKNGYNIVREFCGHGVGRKLHEKPDVMNFGRRGDGKQLKNGTVIAIEPMVNQGVRNVTLDKDGWTVRTADRKLSAHYEHTIVARQGKAEVLSSFEEIEKILKQQ
ncbi:MAG: type I methionyl aminopeptidase [Bacteroidales bacterium]|jgi:methionyl aminopeptidase|nr:type I methionyl aminopeptidase [Bacteroidales bacterium]